MYLGKYRGVPERWKQEGVIVYKQDKVVTGDRVMSTRNLKGTEIQKGVVYRVSKLIIEPNGNVRGFQKRLRLEGEQGDFNPKRFRKIS